MQKSRGQIWLSVNYPNRTIELLDRFFDGRYDFRRSGWIAQGFTNGVESGGVYEITDASIAESFKMIESGSEAEPYTFAMLGNSFGFFDGIARSYNFINFDMVVNLNFRGVS